MSLRGCCSCKCDEITCLCPATFVLIPEPCGLGGLGVVMLPLSEADNPSGPVGWVYGKYICHEDRARG